MAEDPEALVEVEDEDEVEAETEFDLLFPIIPPEDDPAIDTDTGDLVDDLDDFARDEEEDLGEDLEDEDDDALGDDFAFDWDDEEFYAADDGSPLRVTGDDAIAEWALKALNTPQGEYPIYPEEYGNGLHALIGANMSSEAFHAEAGRMIRECLLFHPSIEDVEIEAMRPAPELGSGTYLVTVAMYLAGDDEPVVIEIGV
jgi:hypothetical protein